MNQQLLKLNLFLRAFAFIKIPLLAWVKPRAIEISDARTVMKIPLIHRTKNHLNSMYFGVLCVGAEACIAIKAVLAIQKSKMPVDFVFKDFQAQFLKRAEGDVHFVCEQGEAVEALIQKCITSKTRETQTFESYAIVPNKNPSEKVAEFKITLSVKLR